MRTALLLVLLAGCDDLSGWFEEPAPRQAIPAPKIDGAVYTAVTTSAPVPAPARSAPGDAPDLAAGDGWIVVGACYGDPDARAALRAQMAAHTDWGLAMQGCSEPDYCAWIEAEAVADPDASERIRLGGLGCADALDIYLDPASSDVLRLNWFLARLDDGRPVDHPDMRRSARRILEGDEGPTLGRYAVRALGATRAGQRELLAVLGDLDAPWLVAVIAEELAVVYTPEGQAVQREVCLRLQRYGRVCELEARDPLDDLDASLRDGEVDGRWLLAHFPDHRGAILDALQRCMIEARDGELNAFLGAACLRTLGGEDRARARALVDGVHAWSWPMQPAVHALTTYADDEALVADLVQRGLLEPGAPVAGPDAASALAASRKVVRLEAYGPHAEELLVRRLLGAAGAPELPVRVLPAAREEGLRALTAWVAGRRLRVLVPEPQGMPDAEPLIGFANAVLERAGRTERFAYLNVYPPAAVIGAPTALTRAKDDGLLAVWVPSPQPVDSSEAED